MKSRNTRLIAVPSPIPWESLEGYGERLRRSNFYDEYYWLAHLLEGPINLLRRQRDYDCISALTGYDHSIIRLMTLHRFVDRFLLPEEISGLTKEPDNIEDLLWGEYRSRSCFMAQTGSRGRKVCPICWQKYRTLFLPWSLRHATTCFEHAVLLVDHCVCGKPVRFNLKDGLCFYCGADIGYLPTLSITDHAPSVELSRLVASAIGYIEPFPDPDIMLPDEHPLHYMPPAALFHFLTATVQLLAEHYPEDILFSTEHHLPALQLLEPPADVYVANVSSIHMGLTAIWKLLQDWPDQWHKLLARIAALEDEHRITSRVTFPSVLFRERGMKSQAFWWLLQSWGHFVYNNIDSLPGVFKWRQFYQRLQRQLGDSLELPVLLTTEMASNEIGIRAGYINRSLRITLRQAQAYLGVGSRAFADLIRAELIHAEFQSVHPKRSIKPRSRSIKHFTVSALDMRISMLIGHLSIQSPHTATHDHLTLPKALRLVSSTGVSISGLLKATRDGVISAFRVHDSLLLADVRFVRDGERGLMAYRSHVRPLHGQVEYTSFQTRQILRCVQGTLNRWRQRGLLIPSRIVKDRDGEHFYYNDQVLAAFKERYMTTGEVAKCLDCTYTVVCKWARNGVLPPIVTIPSERYLFERVMVEAIAATQMSIGAAAALLKIDARQIEEWVAQELLQPIAPKEKYWRFDREEVLRLAEQLRQGQSITEHEE